MSCRKFSARKPHIPRGADDRFVPPLGHDPDHDSRTRRCPPPPAATGFLDLDKDAQVDMVFDALLGEGPLEVAAAIRHVADTLRESGQVAFQRLRRGGTLYSAIDAAIRLGVRRWCLDRPRRGYVRAVQLDPKSYDREQWRRCLLASLDGEPTDRDEALRAAAEWGKDNMGLQFERLRNDGVVMKGLKSALNSAVRRGEVERVGGKQVRLGADL